ncbi:MAG: substrate-binding domain-containing protein [Pirellulaceae bacterium]|nr:substrate-binding domain-containing protein [Pirellulaceae bacterium]
MLRLVASGMVLVVTLSMLNGCGSGGSSSPDRIVRVSRQNNSGTYAYFREAVLGKDGQFKLGSIDQSGSKDVVELVSTTPMAIGYSGMGYATPEVTMLAVKKSSGDTAVAPTSENAASGAYPLARGLFIYVLGEPEGATKHYLDWIRSSEGQAIVKEIGYVPVEAIEVKGDTSPRDGRIKVAGSDTMVNLAQAWAEQYMKKYPNVDVQVSGGGSGVGIAKLIEGTVDLANASRDMKPAEREKASENAGGKKVKEITTSLDALAVYVHKENPLKEISLDDLKEIYGEHGTITQWNQVEGWPENEGE